MWAARATLPHAWLERVYDITSDRRFDSQATCFIDVFGLFIIFFLCSTRHYQTSGRLVQEINVCTVLCRHADELAKELNIGTVCMDDLTAECRLYSQATWVIDVNSLFSDILSMGVCSIRHWQTSGRLVQELNVCSVVLDVTYL